MAKKIRVLMVDDEDQFRETTSKILNRKGFEVSMAAGGKEAIEYLEKNNYDVVILDVRMPGIDGHQALFKIKEIQPAARVIMLTGHGGVDSAKASLELGAYDYLSKPCDIDLLTAKINDAYLSLHHEGDIRDEKCAKDVMIPIEDYTTITEDKTVREAIDQLMRSFEGLILTGRVMETGHRSILVFDKDGELSGILSILDLIREVRPDYLSAPKPSMADSMEYSAMFWTGLFTTQAKSLALKPVAEIMSDPPPSVDAETNLMDLANLIFTRGARRLIVLKNGRIAGVVREQEIFFEMASIIQR